MGFICRHHTLLSMCERSALSVRDESFATMTSERCRYEVYIFDKNKLSEETGAGERVQQVLWCDTICGCLFLHSSLI